MTATTLPGSLRSRTALSASVAFAVLLAAQAAHAVPLTLDAAGSLSAALTTVANDFTAATGMPVTTNFLSSGTLRQQIEAGARPDVFASADIGNPAALQAEGLAGPVVNFASNRIVAVVRANEGITSANLLATLLNPSVRVGTSTPILDPQGDYEEQVFANADALSPGAKATLDAKAQRLTAGPTSPPVPAGQNALVYFLDTTNTTDVFLNYYTSAVAAVALDPSLQEIDLPANLAVSAQYGETIINGAQEPGATALENYLLSPTAQSVLAANGFGPPAPVPEPASMAMLGLAVAGLLAVRLRPA
ncbi:MAG: molybdate ABC transporter substrate-binding protein [Janthinobacterium lividum]